MARRRTTTDADATVESPESIVADNGNQPESTPEATPKPRRTRKPTVVADGDETSTVDAAPDATPKPRRTRAKAVEPAAAADAAVVDVPQAADDAPVAARPARARRTAKPVADAAPAPTVVEPTQVPPAVVVTRAPEAPVDPNAPQRTRGRRRAIENTIVVEAPLASNTDDTAPSDEADNTRSRNQRT
ncbi:MAG: hypothetical protein RJB05_1102, partial [Armatimonadota bacterium]